MTIRTRNRFLSFFMFFALFIILGTGIITLQQCITHKFSSPVYIPYMNMQNFILTKYSFIAIILSIFILAIYSFSYFLFVNVQFEKTQSTEIIYFSIFLVGCLAEGFRVFIPIFNTWQEATRISITVSKIVVFARTITPASLLFASLYNEPGHRQYVEQNIFLLFIFSILIAVFLPLNTNVTLPLCHIEFGFKNLFKSIQYSVFVLTFISQIIKNFENAAIHKFPLGTLFISLGYVFLIETFNYTLLILGTVLLYIGTFIYLKRIHKRYLWA